MKVPLSWLREFVDVPADTKRLAEDLTVVGLAVDGVEGTGGDSVLDLDITTNRVDCMNVYGVAREVSVLHGKALQPLDLGFTETGPPAAEAWSVEVEALDLCPRFCGRVFDVRPGVASPAWLRARLEMVGVRPISALVDLTNYVMMEMGHPSHAFDLVRISQGRLRIRMARDGERVTTLDGQDRALRAGIGVVAGEDAPLALAGIMGGATTEVTDATRVVALEAAYWDPLSIRRAAKTLGMHTEASHRFERGADPEGPPVALARFAHLLQKIGAGTCRPGLIDRDARQGAARSVSFRPARASALLGAEVGENEAVRILTGLGCTVSPPVGDKRGTDAPWSVGLPSWRGDMAREADVIEEVGRHFGLGRIPSTLPPARGAEGLRPFQVLDRQLRDTLAGAGLFEAVTYSFVPAADGGAGAPALANPLSDGQAVLRSSLLPGLLAVLRHNARQGAEDVRLFEVGRVFGPGDPLPGEEKRVALLLTGQAGRHFADAPRAFDFFDAKGLVEAVAERAGMDALVFAPDASHPMLHPGQSARVLLGGRPIGVVGALHPDARLESGARGPVLLAEIAIEDAVPRPAARVAALPRHPAAERDLSVLAKSPASAVEVETMIRAAAGPRLARLSLTARYDRPPVPEGWVSLTFRLVFQDPARTLTSEEVQKAVDAVVASLRAKGLDIRGE